MFQMVHVVSMDEVPISVGLCSHQSNDVSGAQNSEDLFCEAQCGRPAKSKAGRQKQRPELTSKAVGPRIRHHAVRNRVWAGRTHIVQQAFLADSVIGQHLPDSEIVAFARNGER